MLKKKKQPGNHLGAMAEQWALKYLISRGLKPETMNYRSPQGEIDLIMWEKSVLVFIEVRLRSTHRHGTAADSIDIHKQRRIIRAAQHFLQHSGVGNNTSCQFDALCLDKDPDNSNQYRVEWLRNAFSL